MTAIRSACAEVFKSQGPYSRRAKLINSLLFILIFANVVVIILESMQEVESYYHSFFVIFEIVSVLIFTVEYFARVWSCVDDEKYEGYGTPWQIRWHYVRSPMAIIDLIVILPFFFAFFFVLDLRALRILRLFRILKLTRYSVAMRTLLSVLKEETPALIAAYVVMLTVVILTSSGIYLLEHDVQPEHFGNIPRAMWWAIVTLTTVGYGDVVPITPLGKLFGGVIALVGISMVALPTGIIASGFGNAFRRNQQAYQEEMEEAFADGGLSDKEKQVLAEMQETLGLSSSDTRKIYKETLAAHLQKHDFVCSKCHKKANQHNYYPQKPVRKHKK